MKILIVEDEVQTSKAYSDHLKRSGYDVEIARDGKEGLTQASIFLPDIILLDIVMPILDGLTMLKQLAVNEKLSHIPVIVLTNLNTIDSISGAVMSGAANYLIKSDLSLEDLDLKIKEVCDNNKIKKFS